MESKKLIVVKYGGSVLEGGSEIRKAAEAIKREYDAGKNIIVVVSALKGLTDKLLSAAEAISATTPPDVVDHIIGMGEEQSVRLMTAALRSLGVDAVEVTLNSPSWPIMTDETYGDAVPILEECKSGAELGLRPLINRGRVPVVSGFVGRSPSGKTTTLGRGGSDTTAVLLAHCLGADELVLVKDVEGIYSADPSKLEDAIYIEALEASDAYLLASTGAKVLQSKVFRYVPENLKIRIVSKSGALDEGGTVISGAIPRLEVKTYERPMLKMLVVGDVISKPEVVTRICRSIQDKGGRVLSLTAQEKAAAFYVDGELLEVLREMHSIVEDTNHIKAVTETEDLALTTIRGRALDDASGLLQKVIGPLASRGIDIHGALIGSSLVSILVEWEKRMEASQIIKESLGGA